MVAFKVWGRWRIRKFDIENYLEKINYIVEEIL